RTALSTGMNFDNPSSASAKADADIPTCSAAPSRLASLPSYSAAFCLASYHTLPAAFVASRPIFYYYQMPSTRLANIQSVNLHCRLVISRQKKYRSPDLLKVGGYAPCSPSPYPKIAHGPFPCSDR